jgi:hypothetical protein
LLLIIGALSTLLNQLNSTTLATKRDKVTSDALAQAKEALIGYAASVNFSGGSERPGDLPCPDRDNDGKAGTTIPLVTSCGNAAGSNQDQRLGRLPWTDLGLPDLRDASGERLWYAVSNNFKNQNRTASLNSDTNGTITVRDTGGNILYDGSTTTGVVAVIIAPGPPTTRQDGLEQNRTAGNINNPLHYLDNIAAEDNADFDETVTLTNGFFTGPARDASGAVIANDRILVVTQTEIMNAIEKRVVREALNCLKDYAADPLNQGRLPWAADMTASGGGIYSDTTNTRFGRLPDDFTKTLDSSGGASPMKNGWTSPCNLNFGTWWNNWRESVFYAVADAYKPQPIPPLPSCGPCLVVNLPSPAANKQAAVFVAGRRLPGVAGGQPRTSAANKGSIANYLENQNATPLDDVFERSKTTSTFNDTTSFTPQ